MRVLPSKRRTSKFNILKKNTDHYKTATRVLARFYFKTPTRVLLFQNMPFSYCETTIRALPRWYTIQAPK